MTSIRQLSAQTSLALFSATNTKSASPMGPLKLDGTLSQLAEAKERNDKVQAAYKLRNDGLAELGKARDAVQTYEDTYEGVMKSGKMSDSISYWARVGGTARNVGDAADKWLKGTQQLIELGEISAYSPDLAKETQSVWQLAGSLLGRIKDLSGKGLGDSRTQSGVLKNVSDVRDLSKKLLGDLDGKFRSFSSLYLNRNPNDVLSGRVDFWV